MIAVITVLLALVLAASHAEAACAWVLWRVAHIDRSEGRIEPAKGFETKNTCEEAAQLERREHERLSLPVSVTYKCLPDTIDPRGPKGGGR